MAIAIKIDIFDAGVRRVIDRVVSLTQDKTPLMRTIGESMVTSTKRRFETGTGPDGKPWKPSYRAKTGKKGPGKTLVKSGRLLRSITFHAGKDSVVIGSNVVYSRIHQLGGTIKPKTKRGLSFKIGKETITVGSVKMPARPYLGLNDQDRNIIRRRLVNFFSEVVK